MAPPKPAVPGFLKGLGVTARTAKETMFPDGLRNPIPQPTKGAATVQYPHEKEAITPRARGVISLNEDNCTACMLCARECPDWCIYIEAHAIDRSDIDFALCMYCGICVEVCPFEALYWSPEYEYSEVRIADLLHDKSRLAQWFETVPDIEPLEAGSQVKQKPVSRKGAK